MQSTSVFLDVTKVAISGELIGVVTRKTQEVCHIIYLVPGCSKFHHCRIYVLFCLPHL